MTGQSGLFWPIFPLFLLSRGVSFAGIGTLLAVQAGTTLVAEIPTGFVGDHIGRRNSLVVGSVLVGVAELGFVAAHGFPGFVAVYVAYGLGSALRSGSGDAWLYDVLAARGESARFTAVRGRGESATHWASALCMVASGGLYLVDPAVPFLAAAGLTVLNTAVLTTFPPVRNSDTDADEMAIPLGALAPLVRETLGSAVLRSVVVIAAAFFAIERAITEFVPTVAKSAIDTTEWIQHIAADPTVVQVFSVGLLFAFLTATSAVAGSFTGRVQRSLGAVAGLVLAGSISAVFLASAWLSTGLAIAGFVLVKTADAIVRPLVTGYVNDQLEIAGRATILSVMSMVFTVTQMPVLVATGALADSTGVRPAVAALGLGFLCVVGLVLASDVVLDSG